MRKRITACQMAMTMLCMTGCEQLSAMLDTGGVSGWINSDIKESFDNAGEIRLQDDFAAAVNRDWAFTRSKGRRNDESDQSGPWPYHQGSAPLHIHGAPDRTARVRCHGSQERGSL